MLLLGQHTDLESKHSSVLCATLTCNKVKFVLKLTLSPSCLTASDGNKVRLVMLDCHTALPQELKDFQRDGHSLEDLWKVAKGDIKYQDFVGSSIPRKGKKEPPQAPPPVPEELVSCPSACDAG